jgi:hypothetical protein
MDETYKSVTVLGNESMMHTINLARSPVRLTEELKLE